MTKSSVAVLSLVMVTVFSACVHTSADLHANSTLLCERLSGRVKVLGEDTWYGYHRTRFSFKGVEAWVVEPSVQPAAGRPWTWTMQWAEAFVDRTGVLDLLKQGYHHATIDLFSTRMDEKGLQIAAEFQDFLTETLGFSKKARLVGMSWGGFFSIRYAAKNPQKVAKIYLDAPLLTFEGFSHSDIGPWVKQKPASGWGNDPRMPVNQAETIAKAGIPLLLLYGGADQTVPPKLNSEAFIARFKSAGGKIDVRYRSFYGHHPHGFDPDKTAPIVTFFSGCE